MSTPAELQFPSEPSIRRTQIVIVGGAAAGLELAAKLEAGVRAGTSSRPPIF